MTTAGIYRQLITWLFEGKVLVDVIFREIPESQVHSTLNVPLGVTQGCRLKIAILQENIYMISQIVRNHLKSGTFKILDERLILSPKKKFTSYFKNLHLIRVSLGNYVFCNFVR